MTLLQPARREGHRYLNPVPTAVGGPRMALKVLPLYLSNRAETEPKHPLGPFVTDPQLLQLPPASGLRVTWFGHSSLLVELDGLRVLIDPVWEQRASPFQWMGPRRFFAPTLRLEQLPDIDVILISHDHYDHLGRHTVRRLSQLNATAAARWVTAAGVGRRLRQFGVPEGRIAELDWTQSVEVYGREPGSSMTLTMWPSRHFSGRTIWDRFTTLWGAYVLQGPRHCVYYGADSGYWEGFAAIAERYPRFDLTLLEIGAFSPLWADIHLGPDGALRAYQAMGGDARAGLLMPIHWGLFNLALHGWREPVERVLELARERGASLWLPRPGEPTEVLGPLQSNWWVRAADPSAVR